MKTTQYALSLTLILSLLGSLLAPTVPANLHDVVNTPHNSYEVWYTNDNPYTSPPGPGSDLNYLPDVQPQRASDALDNNNVSTTGNPNGNHNGFINLGFIAPDFLGTPRRVFMYNCSGCDSGNAPADLINMPSLSYRDASEACIRLVIGHELFHHVQFGYITFNKWSTWGTMPVEGTARYMQDKLYSDLDANTGCITYLSQVNSFLGNPNQSIWDASYSSALFWNYLAEQLGTTVGEPSVGVNFVRTFWERAQADNAAPNTVKALREAITAYKPLDTLEALFQDFTITNYVKQLDLSKLGTPSRYRYIDESDAAATPYNAVALNWSGTIPPIKQSTVSVSRWGAQYLQADTSTCTSGIVGFKATSTKEVGFALVGIKGGVVDRLVKSTGTSFSRALVQPGVDPYTRLAAVITGRDQAATVTYTFDCAQPKLSIKEPKYPNTVAYVGKFADPSPFLLKVSVQGPTSLGELSIEGLDSDDFLVYVGSESAANQATVLTSSYVQGDYWMVVQPPTKAAGSPVAYNVVVRLNPSLVAANEAAVRYEEKTIDEVLVIDRSGSMSEPAGSTKIDAAKLAAWLYVDSTRDTDKIGVASFSDDAILNAYMRLASDPGVRNTMKMAIGGLVASGWTSIGDGLKVANDDLLPAGHGRPSPPTERWIVLLSDGMENTSLFWSDVRTTILANHIKVNTIALGPYTDQVLLQAIATDTGGNYYYVDLPPGSAALSLAAPVYPIELGDAYALSAEKVQSHERIWEQAGSLGPSERVELNIPIEEDEVLDGLFTFLWNQDGQATVNVFDPSGTRLEDGVNAQILTDSTHVTMRVDKMAPGTWTASLEGKTGINYRASLSGVVRHGAQMHLYLGAYGVSGGSLNVNQVLPGQPMPIFVSLTDPKGVVLGADITAQVTHPDGSVMTLLLSDDGSNGDVQADDGVYSGNYTRTTVGSRTGQNDTVYSKNGSYAVAVNATGKDNLGGIFTRVGKTSFTVYQDPERSRDSDKDQMPDQYEDLHTCLDKLVFDGDQDPDFDNLISLDEYQIGTDPCWADTDNGGEGDGSEVKRDSNPFIPRDDQVKRPIDFQVISKLSEHLAPQPPIQPNANLIRYAVDPNYASLMMLRSDDPDGPFKLVAEFDPVSEGGLYLDKGLINGQTYYYILQGVTKTGASSAPSDVFSGTPQADPYQPIGNVVIENGAAFVDTTLVTLTMVIDQDVITEIGKLENDVKEMMISNRSDFNGAVWQTYAPTVPWTLAITRSGRSTVYAKYRDATGNESSVYFDDIIVKGARSLGAVHIRISLKLLTPLTMLNLQPAQMVEKPGATMVVLNDSLYGPAYSNETGDATLTNLLPGTYDLEIDYPGYIPVTLKGVVIKAGETTELTSLTLEPLKKIHLPSLRR